MDRLGTLQGSVTTPAGKQQQNRADATSQAPKPLRTGQPFLAPPASHGSSAAPGRGEIPAWGLKAHPKALQVGKLVQGPACITQLTSSKTREPPEPQPPVYQRHSFPFLNAQREKLPGLYLPGPLPARNQNWGREEGSEPQLSRG